MLFNKKRSIIILLLIWFVATLISAPFLWMVDFIDKPDQCQLNMTLLHLVYVIGLNVTFVFTPTIALSVLYIFIINKIRRVYKFRNDISDSHLRKNSKVSLVSRRKSENQKLFQDKLENKDQCDQFEIRINDEIPELKCDDKNYLNVEEPKRIIKFKSNSCPEIQFNHEFITLKNQCNNANKATMKEQRLSINHSIKSTCNNKLKTTIIISLITIIFFCCQLPIRIFLCWSYIKNYVSPIELEEYQPVNRPSDDIDIMNILSHLVRLVYFLHCISNPIIYNILSIKFRTAFMNFFYEE